MIHIKYYIYHGNLFKPTNPNRSPQAGKRENWQFADLSRLQFTSDESELIPDYI